MSDEHERHVIIEDETLAQGFTQIPNGVLRRSDVPPGAKLTYMVLLSYAWQKETAYPGQDRLAEDMGVTERSVRTYLDQLQKSGLISVQRRGLGQTNVYVLHRLPRPENISDQERKQASGQEVQNFPPKNTQEKKTKIEEDDSKIRKPTPLYDNDRDVIRQVIGDFARELGDEAPLVSTVSRAVALYRRSGLDLDSFCVLLYEARGMTQERTASIKRTQDGGSGWSRKNKIPYFFGVLEDRLGLDQD